MTNNLLFPHASFLGFDNLFQQLERANQRALPPYPPCNIVKHGENKIDIEMAVAGFSMDDLDIECDKNILTIKGFKLDAADSSRDYIHQGISHKKFARKFTLAEHIEVTGATLVNGILSVQLEHIIPEELRPRKIAIQQ